MVFETSVLYPPAAAVWGGLNTWSVSFYLSIKQLNKQNIHCLPLFELVEDLWKLANSFHYKFLKRLRYFSCQFVYLLCFT